MTDNNIIEESQEEIDTNMDMTEPALKDAESTDETESAVTGDASEDTGDGSDDTADSAPECDTNCDCDCTAEDDYGITDSQYKDMHIFLDEMRASGVVNMLGAGPNLAKEFDLTRNIAKIVLNGWMQLK